MIRQAAFKGLRHDKSARDVVAELPAPTAALDITSKEARNPMINKRFIAKKHAAPSAAAADKGPGPVIVLGVTISKPDKALWPDAGDDRPVTKADLARYYEDVGDWLMPHLAGRPCSLLRVPDGVGAEQFFQRHATANMSNFLTSVKVRGDKAPYLQIDRVEGLIAAAQVGTLEIHPWNCAPGDPEVAGRLVFDLAPAPDVTFEVVLAAAIEIRDRLKRTGLESF